MVFVQGSTSYADPAAKIQMREDVVRGIARYAIAKYVFLEVRGSDGLANSSKMLRVLPGSDWSARRCPPPRRRRFRPGSQEPQYSMIFLTLSQHMSSSGDCRSTQNTIEICICAWSTSTPTRNWRYITRATRPLAGTWFHSSSVLATRLDSPGWSSRRTCQR